MGTIARFENGDIFQFALEYSECFHQQLDEIALGFEFDSQLVE